MKSLKEWLAERLKQDRRRAQRHSSPGLAAYYWTGASPKGNRLRDISTTGAFLLTDDHWRPGTMLSLTLQKDGVPEQSPDRWIAVEARAVRSEETGIGLSFILPKDKRVRHPESVLENGASQ